MIKECVTRGNESKAANRSIKGLNKHITGTDQRLVVWINTQSIDYYLLISVLLIVSAISFRLMHNSIKHLLTDVCDIFGHADKIML